MSGVGRGILAGLLILSGSVWVGGLVLVVVVARVTAWTLEPAARVAFFRTFGRAVALVSNPALVVALVTGALLLHARLWSGLVIATWALGGLLVAVAAAGMWQARRMTRLRQSLLGRERPPPAALQRASRRALALRSLIALVTLVLVGLAAALTV
ncbi:MAG: hypothetical protein ACREN7_00465 [Candidatus Dormibacteria bacterium]